MPAFDGQRRFVLLVLFCVVALGGCGPLAMSGGPLAMSGVPFLGQADALTVVGTDKTIVDHFVSISSGKNCSTVRREQGLHYCEEDEPEIKARVYCYNTLGRVTCYDRPDPHTNGVQKVGDNSHNLVDPLRQRQRQRDALFEDLSKK